MDTETCYMLRRLADLYENEAFLAADPSQFMHRYATPVRQERAAFIASCLSYGSREIFIPKIDYLLGRDTLLGDASRLPDNDDKFYRFDSNRMVNRLLLALDRLYDTYGSMLGLIGAHDVHTGLGAVQCLVDYFSHEGVEHLVPKDTASCCKRLCMFLRWMVRDHSAVDLGLWSHQIDKSTLVMPLDTHVLQQSVRLGLIDKATGSMRTAQRLTEALRELFPGDPTRADFALFGLGAIG